MMNRIIQQAARAASVALGLVWLPFWPFSALVAVSVLMLSVDTVAQETAPYQRTHTNDDFRVPRTLPVTPAQDAPAQSDAPPVTGAAAPPLSGAAQAETKPPTDAPSADETPFAELIARQDANGNWVLVSRALPPPPKGDVLPAAPLAPISTGKPDLDAIIMEMATKYGVDPKLIVEVIRQESGFNPYAVSTAGAKGLMQLIDGTAARMGTRNVFDARQNIEGGVKYLRLLLDMFNGDVSLALAGYNAGEHRVIRNGYQVPNIAETKHYVKAILARYGRPSHHTTKPASPKPTATTPPDEPTPEPLRVIIRDGVPLLTNR
ncbi:MAG: lytic transglycosylase domain-containing protein [Chloracidobacterium sp.]